MSGAIVAISIVALICMALVSSISVVMANITKGE